MWDTTEVEVWSSMCFDHVFVILGRFVKSGVQFVVFNVMPLVILCVNRFCGIIYQID